VLLGDANRVNTDNERLQAVTAEDVQRAMKKYFTDTNRVVIYFLPKNPPEGEGKMEMGAGNLSEDAVPATNKRAEGGR
jgi:hypothetical protein